ncbi:hypothetical protein [Nocardioides ochotonae]|uniref:hypothetical protein n=1 Tax=Nocardioides ochotonae TaxID=2685869 RepID=UPI00140CC98B|nr:hypothetical protein [Nocardioides ochotonae]
MTRLGGTLPRLLLPVGAALLGSSLLGCSSRAEAPEPLTNAGIRDLVRDKWQYQEEQMAACMKSEGFDYFPREFDEDSLVLPTGNRKDARYMEVTLTVDEVKQKGFGVTTNSGSTELSDREDKNDQYAAGLSHAVYAAYQLALEGEKGCDATAASAMDKSFQQRESDLERSTETIRTFVFSSAEFAAMSKEWSSCMAQRGWDRANLVEFDSTIREEAQKRMDAIAVPSSSTEEGPAAIFYPTKELEDIHKYEVGAAVDFVECFDTIRSDYDDLLEQAHERLA